jgi:hypothetical protein
MGITACKVLTVDAKAYIVRPMSESERERVVRQEHGRAAVRALWRTEFEAVGRERREAMRLIDAQVAKVGRLLQDALASGMTIAEVSRLGVSRPTLYAQRARFADEPRDVAFGVLQAIATDFQDAPIFDDPRGLEQFKTLKEQGFVDEAAVEGEYGEITGVAAFLTPEGMRLLEGWEFEQEEQETLSARHAEIAAELEGEG